MHVLHVCNHPLRLLKWQSHSSNSKTEARNSQQSVYVYTLLYQAFRSTTAPFCFFF